MKFVAQILFCSIALFSGALHAIDPFAEMGFSNDEGARTFSMQCSGCHGEGAGGRDGMAPNFADEWFRLTKPDTELARNIRNGFKTPGKFYSGGTCSVSQLSDKEISDVLVYMRQLVGQ